MELALKDYLSPIYHSFYSKVGKIEQNCTEKSIDVHSMELKSASLFLNIVQDRNAPVDGMSCAMPFRDNVKKVRAHWSFFATEQFTTCRETSVSVFVVRCLARQTS